MEREGDELQVGKLIESTDESRSVGKEGDSAFGMEVVLDYSMEDRARNDIHQQK